jgi:hypothetical protein
MKIIISESQYSSLFESNNEKNKKLVGKMWEEGMDFDEMSELIGIGKTDIVLHLKDKPINIDCEFAEELTSLLFWKTDFINKKYSFNDGKSTLEFTWGGFSGIIYFTYEDESYEMIGMASPYWNGDCFIPVDLASIENKMTGDIDDGISEDSGIQFENVPSEFSSIQEMIDFLNTVYPREVYKAIPKLISMYS